MLALCPQVNMDITNFSMPDVYFPTIIENIFSMFLLSMFFYKYIFLFVVVLSAALLNLFVVLTLYLHTEMKEHSSSASFFSFCCASLLCVHRSRCIQHYKVYFLTSDETFGRWLVLLSFHSTNNAFETYAHDGFDRRCSGAEKQQSTAHSTIYSAN